MTHFLRTNSLPLILLLGFALRFYGVDFGLPYLYHADEPIVVNHALAYGSGDLNPHFFRIPPLVSYLLFGVYGLYFIFTLVSGVVSNAQEFAFLFFGDPTSFYLIARILFGVILGTASIAVLYVVIKKHFSTSHAWITALFLSTCFLHARDSHYIYVDIALVVVLLLSFYVFFNLKDKPDNFKLHLLSGVMIGIAAATKYNGGAVFIVYLMLSFVWNAKLLKYWFSAGAASLVIYLLLNPYTLLDFNFFLKEIVGETQSHVEGVGWTLHAVHSMLGAVGVPIYLLGLAGMLQPKTWRDPKRRGFAVFILVYFVILKYLAQPYPRYVLPVAPFFLFFAADIIESFASRFGAKARLVGTLCILICISIPLLKTMSWGHLMSKEDTRTLAKNWIEENVPTESRVALNSDFYAPDLNFSRNELLKRKHALDPKDPFFETQSKRLDFLIKRYESQNTYELLLLTREPSEHTSTFLFEKEKITYDALISSSQTVHYLVVAKLSQDYDPAPFQTFLTSKATRVAAFSPYRGNSTEWMIETPLTGGPFMLRDILRRERNGPPLEIYKL